MDKPKAAILTGFGINSELETAYALEKAGASTSLVHFSELEKNPSLLENFQIFALSGGWSFADQIQSGRILANKFRFKLLKEFKKFCDEKKAVIGICNGFQVLTQLGALPGWENWEKKEISLLTNTSSRFEDRWIRLRTESSVCKFSAGLERCFVLPIRHGEGRLVVKNSSTLELLEEKRQIVFRYAAEDGFKAYDYPDNPNGSVDSIAGICNEEGNILGLMPHPECHIREFQNPFWTNSKAAENKNFFDSLFDKLSEEKKFIYNNSQPLFKSIVEYAKRF
ncbi:MAG: phosphoribosylformylglycinamidine synthase I [Candidatus Anstonellaceae archaeon]